MDDMKFFNFVSLGSACPVAASLSKYGLRGWSGVFDWLVTDDFSWVLHYLETDFKDFLQKENLEIFRDNPKYFRDKASGFLFIHEEYYFMSEYAKLKDKYAHRINNFLNRTQSRTCFLRAIASDEEVKYIQENGPYISRIVKKNNPDNEIIFFIKDGVKVPLSLAFPFYVVKGPYAGGVTREELRNWLDASPKFLQFCAEHTDSITLMNNLIFDAKKEAPSEQIKRHRYQLATELLKTDFETISLPKEIIIYGAGNIGESFFRRIRTKCKIVAFVDERMQGKKIDEIPILGLENIDYEKAVPFVVTATYDYYAIRQKIREYDEKVEVLSLDEILKNK